MRVHLPFSELSPEQQKWAVSDTWCEHCSAADLGVINPTRFRENGKEYISGNCRVCGNVCVTEILNIESKK